MEVRLQPWQHDFISCGSPIRIICAGRKSGKTYILPYDMILQAQQGAERILYITPAADQLGEIWRRFLDPEFSNVTQTIRKSPKRIILTLGCEIDFKTAGSGDSLRSSKYDVIYFDESAFLQDDVRVQVLPMLSVSKNPKQIWISTPNGDSGYFYDLFQSTPNNHKWHLPSSVSPYVSKTFLEEQRLKLPPNEYAQEYLAEFVGSGNQAVSDFSKCIVSSYLYEDEPVGSIGIDFGRHNDRTVITTLDTRSQVRDCRAISGTWPDQINKIQKYCSYFPRVPVIVDSTGGGDVVYEMLKQQVRNIHGFVFTQRSRTDLYQSLISAVQSGSVQIHTQFRELIQELKELKYTKQGLNWRYDHESGKHDDACCSLALALHGLQKRDLNRRTLELAYV